MTATRTRRAASALTSAALVVIGAIGLANSWGSMYSSATRHMTGTALPTVTIGGSEISLAGASLPIIIDLLIIVASSRYVVGVLERRPVGGWRAAAHAAVTTTVVMNALAATETRDIGWHIIAPAVLSIVIELVAREILGQLRDVTLTRGDRIPIRLWITTPAESARVAWRMARTGCTSATQARTDTEACAAARDRLRAALPGRTHRRARRQILRRLWSGALTPDALVAALPGAAESDTLARLLDGVALRRPAPEALRPTAPEAEAPRGDGARAERSEAAPASAPGANEAEQPEAEAEANPEAKRSGLTIEAVPAPEAARRAAALASARPRVTAPVEAAPLPPTRGEDLTVADLIAAAQRHGFRPTDRDAAARHLRVGKPRAQALVRAYRDQVGGNGQEPGGERQDGQQETGEKA